MRLRLSRPGRTMDMTSFKVMTRSSGLPEDALQAAAGRRGFAPSAFLGPRRSPLHTVVGSPAMLTLRDRILGGNPTGS
jgi:hypothetical protein